jgi:hypothetical protein
MICQDVTLGYLTCGQYQSVSNISYVWMLGLDTFSSPEGLFGKILVDRWLSTSGKCVRRQGFWNQWQLKLRESSAHLVGLIMRRVVCDASVAFRVSFV